MLILSKRNGSEGKSTDPRVLKLTWRALRSVFSLSTRDKPLNLERYASCSDHTDKLYSRQLLFSYPNAV